ncbi:MAG: glycoside hydrolase family 2, partial [Candidatus Hydrogenedentes bacterium]|nr:glycoside hydrolase family 2 [Candidatus Hydrogenedentota bacterium]
MNETPHRNKVIPYTAGGSFDHGGLVDSVELLVSPAQRVTDVFAEPDAKTGDVQVHASVNNSSKENVPARIEFAIAPAMSGETLHSVSTSQSLVPGANQVQAVLHVDSPRLWQLSEPTLYRVTVRVLAEGVNSYDEYSVRCGFRDFRFENGYFRLNGKRLLLRCSHTGNHSPVGLQMPPDPDMLRRDLINVKMMGFNSIRFIAGVATRFQLDLCDEIGLLVYEEHFGSWYLADSPKMAERFDRGLVEMIKRDRNHPSVAMWGLLNETSDGAVFRHAVDALPLVREHDQTRLVMLNSGRFDGQGGDSLTGMEMWRASFDSNPNIMHNPTSMTKSVLGITWKPGQLSMHPGQRGEYAVLRWNCSTAGAYTIKGVFSSIAERATTDAHVLHNGQSLYSGFVNVNDAGSENAFELRVQASAGDTVDWVLGYGNGDYGADTTALAVQVVSADGKACDPATDFSVGRNPNGPWSYGYFAPVATPDAATFKPFDVGRVQEAIGTLSNPGSSVWEDVLNDQHPYQRTPHTASVIQFLRTVNGGQNPVFISEYGVGSGVDLWRVARHYERIGKEGAEDAQFYRDKLDRFLADWERWKLDECFASPQDFFAASLRKMAGQRLLGLNAIRANPNMAGHSLTGTVDQGMSGEGLFTTFRELKPGTTDAL